MVALMPQGTIPRVELFFDPDPQGTLGRGPARGDDEGARHPDRAVGHREGVAPRARLPNVTNLTEPARPCARASARPWPWATTTWPPTPLGSWRRSVALLPAEARERRTPTAEEIALAMPSH